MKTAIVAFACIFWFVAPAFGQRSVPPPTGILGDGYFHEVFEKDRGKFYPLTPSTQAVDANADLIVSFDPGQKGEAGSPGLAWEQVTNALAFVRDNIEARKALTAQLAGLARDDTNAVTMYTNAIRTLNSETIRRLRALRTEARMSAEEWDRILDGEFDNRPSRRPYENLGRWLTNRLDTLQRELDRFAAAHTVQVTVQAFHFPGKGLPVAVHVENYDNIHAGEYRPIDRLGLRMNEAEQKEFSAKLQAAQSAAQAIREVQTNKTQMEGFFRDKLEEVRKQLDGVAKLLESDAADWQADFANTETAKALAGLTNNPNGNVGRAAAELLSDLGQFNDDFRDAAALYSKITKLISQIGRAKESGLADMVAGMQQIGVGVSQLNTAANSLLAQLPQWPIRLQRVESNIGVIASHLAEDIRSRLLPEATRRLIEDFSAKFPNTAVFLQLAATTLSRTSDDNGASAVAEAVAAASHEQTWLEALDAVPGTVELARTGLAPGDLIKVRVSYREHGTNGTPGKVIAADEYKVETVLMGLHRKFGASVIFARGLGTAPGESEWKPNVAAHVHWFYRHRYENWWRTVWNRLSPGIGVHLASLDQGEDSVEFGAGVNASLCDGLILGGVGYNLSNNEEPYIFFGLSLLDMLEKSKKLTQ